MSNADDDSPESDVARLERDVGARPGLFIQLLQAEDDWTFIIKAHALVEAAVTHLLTEACGRDELRKLFSRIELSNATTGKIAFAKALGVIESSERSTIRKLSELRNDLVHDVSRTEFNLKAWVKGLKADQFREFLHAFGPGGETVTIAGHTEPSAEHFRKYPRFCIWFACLLLLSLLYRRKELARSQNEMRASVYEKFLQLVELAGPAGSHDAGKGDA